MEKVTSKSTKDVIYNAYKEAMEKIAKMEQEKFDPVAEKEAARKKEMFKSADEIIKSGILNDTVVEQYLNLEAAIEAKKKELQEMYNIEKEASTFTALVNAHKDKEEELKTEYALKEKTAVEALEQRKAEIEAEIASLLENYKAKIADNKAIPIYNKYYKRYSARVKVRQIKEADFKKWKYQAMSKRDECTDGIITPEKFTERMENSFPNRKPKS